MKRILTLTLGVCLLVATPALAQLEGAWTASANQIHPDRISISLAYGRHNQNGSTMKLSRFTGLTEALMHSATMTPVQFTLESEAGKVVFEGTFRNAKGAGQFTFTGNSAYRDAIARLGVKFDLDRGRTKDEQETLFTLTLFDVSTAFIRSMQAEGYHETLEKYLQMRIFDITPDYIREMRSLGFRSVSTDELVASKIHRVTPTYIREMRNAGWDLTLDEYQSARIFKVTPDFAEEMKRLGYPNLSRDELTSFRIHNVTPEFIRELRELGYDHVGADDLIAMRIHKVTPEFIRELGQAGDHGVPVEKLVALKMTGVERKYVRKKSAQ